MHSMPLETSPPPQDRLPWASIPLKKQMIQWSLANRDPLASFAATLEAPRPARTSRNSEEEPLLLGLA